MNHFNYHNYIGELSQKNIIVIITGNLTGGSYKWINDLNILNKNNVHLIKKKERLINILNNTKNDKIIILQSLLNTNINITDIFELQEKNKFKIILPIHDWYWINPPYIQNNLKNIHSAYLSIKKDNIQEITNKLFNKSHKIICPSLFVFNIIIELFPNLNNIYLSNWVDIKGIEKIEKKTLLNNTINIGVLTGLSECKGKESIKFLRRHIRCYNGYKITYFIVGHTIEKYEDNYQSFLNIINKYNINGLLFLNKWGETWCYSLTKGLNCGLPIFYNNIGSFKERVPKNDEKYIININNESEYTNFGELRVNFENFLKYIIEKY